MKSRYSKRDYELVASVIKEARGMFEKGRRDRHAGAYRRAHRCYVPGG